MDYLKKGDPIAKVVDLDPIFITINITEKEIYIEKHYLLSLLLLKK